MLSPESNPRSFHKRKSFGWFQLGVVTAVVVSSPHCVAPSESVRRPPDSDGCTSVAGTVTASSATMGMGRLAVSVVVVCESPLIYCFG